MCAKVLFMPAVVRLSVVPTFQRLPHQQQQWPSAPLPSPCAAWWAHPWLGDTLVDNNYTAFITQVNWVVMNLMFNCDPSAALRCLSPLPPPTRCTTMLHQWSRSLLTLACIVECSLWASKDHHRLMCPHSLAPSVSSLPTSPPWLSSSPAWSLSMRMMAPPRSSLSPQGKMLTGWCCCPKSISTFVSGHEVNKPSHALLSRLMVQCRPKPLT